MSEPKFTKGPLKVICESADPDWCAVATAGGAIVANVNGADRANAHLIAAAPDLYVALTMFRTKVYNAAILNGMDDKWATEACAEADTALAKARGQS